MVKPTFIVIGVFIVAVVIPVSLFYAGCEWTLRNRLFDLTYLKPRNKDLARGIVQSSGAYVVVGTGEAARVARFCPEPFFKPDLSSFPVYRQHGEYYWTIPDMFRKGRRRTAAFFLAVFPEYYVTSEVEHVSVADIEAQARALEYWSARQETHQLPEQ